IILAIALSAAAGAWLLWPIPARSSCCLPDTTHLRQLLAARAAQRAEPPSGIRLFDGRKASVAELPGQLLRSCSLVGVRWAGVDLCHVFFHWVDLSGADLAGADLRDAFFG